MADQDLNSFTMNHDEQRWWVMVEGNESRRPIPHEDWFRGSNYSKNYSIMPRMILKRRWLNTTDTEQILLRVEIDRELKSWSNGLPLQFTIRRIWLLCRVKRLWAWEFTTTDLEKMMAKCNWSDDPASPIPWWWSNVILWGQGSIAENLVEFIVTVPVQMKT